VDANAPFHATFVRDTSIAFRCQLLQSESTFDGTDH